MRDTEPIGLAGGQWLPRRGVRVWTPDPPPPPRRIVNVHELIACPTCRARCDEVCKTRRGNRTSPHASRLTPRLCPCGELVGWKRRYCDECTKTSFAEAQQQWRDRRRRNGGGEAA